MQPAQVPCLCHAALQPWPAGAVVVWIPDVRNVLDQFNRGHEGVDGCPACCAPFIGRDPQSTTPIAASGLIGRLAIRDTSWTQCSQPLFPAAPMSGQPLSPAIRSSSMLFLPGSVRGTCWLARRRQRGRGELLVPVGGSGWHVVDSPGNPPSAMGESEFTLDGLYLLQGLHSDQCNQAGHRRLEGTCCPRQQGRLGGRRAA